MAMVHLTIDGVPVSVEEGTTVLKAAHAAGIKIPTLCWLKDINEIGACRMCVVDVGARSLAAACVMPVSEGMVVKTNTPQVRQARRAVLELILSNHERKCLSCVRSQNCELQDLAKIISPRPSSATRTSASCAAAAWPSAAMCRRSARSAR